MNYVEDLPRSVRSVTDLRNRRIYLKQEPVGSTRRGRSCCRRSATSCSAMTCRATSPTSSGSGSRRTTSPPRCSCRRQPPRRSWPTPSRPGTCRVEDLRDVFSVSYEMAAHRFTNLATHHLGLPVTSSRTTRAASSTRPTRTTAWCCPPTRRVRSRASGMCRQWAGRRVFAAADRFRPYCQYSDTPSGTYWCIAHVDPRPTSAVRHHARRAVTSTPAGSAAGRRPRGRVALPRRRVLPAPAGRAGRAVGRHGVAVGPGALAHPVRAADRQLPRRGRGRHVRVPRSARPRLNAFPASQRAPAQGAGAVDGARRRAG